MFEESKNLKLDQIRYIVTGNLLELAQDYFGDDIEHLPLAAAAINIAHKIESIGRIEKADFNQMEEILNILYTEPPRVEISINGNKIEKVGDTFKIGEETLSDKTLGSFKGPNGAYDDNYWTTNTNSLRKDLASFMTTIGTSAQIKDTESLSDKLDSIDSQKFVGRMKKLLVESTEHEKILYSALKGNFLPMWDYFKNSPELDMDNVELVGRSKAVAIAKFIAYSEKGKGKGKGEGEALFRASNMVQFLTSNYSGMIENDKLSQQAHILKTVEDKEFIQKFLYKPVQLNYLIDSIYISEDSDKDRALTIIRTLLGERNSYTKKDKETMEANIAPIILIALGEKIEISIDLVKTDIARISDHTPIAAGLLSDEKVYSSVSDEENASKMQISRSTLAHEICHAVDQKLGGGDKFFSSENQQFKKITQALYKRHLDYKDSIPEIIADGFAEGYIKGMNEEKNVTEAMIHETLARTTEIIARNGLIGLDLLRSKTPELLEFYQDIFLPKCKDYLKDMPQPSTPRKPITSASSVETTPDKNQGQSDAAKQEQEDATLKRNPPPNFPLFHTDREANPQSFVFNPVARIKGGPEKPSNSRS